MLLFIGTGEIIVILFVAFLLFGTKKIPELARTLGKGMAEIKKTTNDIKKEINEQQKELTNTKESL